MWTLNGTFGWAPDQDSKEVGGTTSLPWLPWSGAVVGVVAVVTVTLNVLLLLALLVDEFSRSRSFHLHIVNMAVIAVLQGAGVLPLWTHYLIAGTWVHGGSLCGWWLAADTLVTSLAAMALIVTASDRFIYLVCWRFVKEGGKYVSSFALLALTWLLALAVTLTVTLVDLDTDAPGSKVTGSEREELCMWGQARQQRVVITRLIIYAVGAGLGTGLCLALATLPCLGIGHELPIDEDDQNIVRKSSILLRQHSHHISRSDPDPNPDPDPDSDRARKSPLLLRKGKGEEVEFNEDFPRFAFIKKTDRLEERENWKWQVVSLLTVAVSWTLLWLPSHLFVLAHDILALHWALPPWALLAALVLGYSHAALTPLLWLLHRPVRQALWRLLTCQCCKAAGEEEEDDSAVFQEVGPYRSQQVAG